MSESGSDIAGRVARLEEQEQRVARALEILAAREAEPAARRGKDWDAYAAVIASFIGLLALAVSGYTAYVQRQQLRAQVWPHLLLYISNVSTGPRYFLANAGTGPARITAARVVVDGHTARSQEEIVTATGLVAEGLIWSTLSTAVIPADKELAFVKAKDDEASRAQLIKLMTGAQHRMSLTVCYCSVLDQCWVAYHGGGKRPAEDGAEEACPIAAADRFTD